MKKKWILYSEAAYILGLVILALGTALMEKAAFGMSMVVAPAYLLHLKLVDTLPFFSFGMVVCSLGVALLFHTYISPEDYELFVKEMAERHI